MSSRNGCGRSSAQIEEARLRRGVEVAADDRAAVLERLEQVGREPELRPLRRRPGVRQSLDAVRVGVLRRGEAAAREQHLAQQVPDRLLDDRAVAVLACHDPRMEVGGGQQRVVVEHLLEVRHDPARVDGVAVEAAADDVVQAAGGHPVERPSHHPESLVPAAAQEELDRGRGRELRRGPEAAEGGLVVAGEPALRGVEERGRQRPLARLEAGCAAERGHEPLRLRLEVVAPVVPRTGDRLQDLPKARQPVTRVRGKVGAGVERSPVRRQEHRGRPATLSGHRHTRLHRQRVDVGPFLAVDLDVDEQLVHQRRGCLIRERLVLHDVAPVARAVADRDQERATRLLRLRERLVAPRKPVDRVVRVLEEVRARGSCEPVHRAPYVASPSGVAPRVERRLPMYQRIASTPTATPIAMRKPRNRPFQGWSSKVLPPM